MPTSTRLCLPLAARPCCWGFVAWAALAAVSVLCVSSNAYADLYKYRDKDGNVMFTSAPRDDLELIEVIAETKPKPKPKPKPSKTTTTVVKKAGADSGSETDAETPVHRNRSKETIRADQTRYDHIIREAADAYELPFAFVKAVIKIESNYNRYAVSRVGAMGLMQLMPGTAEDMGVTDAFDARQNIYGGTKYLRLMANKYNGDINLVLAAYNAGPGNVDKYGGIPFEGTSDYVRNVFHWYQSYDGDGDTGEE